MHARTPVTAAAAAYAANCTLGGAVAAALVDTSRARWVHHALYILTAALSAAALACPLYSEQRRTAVRSALALAPAAIPLAAIPYAGTHGGRHVRVALSAAPFFVAALARAWR